MSLVVAVLLVATLLTITVNERLGEIATLRAIGVGRGTVVRQVLAEGAALTVVGGGAGHPARAGHGALSRRDPDQLPRPAGGVLLLRASRRHAGVAAVVLLRHRLARGPLSRLARLAAPIAATLRAEAT